MNNNKIGRLSVFLTVVLAFSCFFGKTAEGKIGVVNEMKVLEESTEGKSILANYEKRTASIRKDLEKDWNEIEVLRKKIDDGKKEKNSQVSQEDIQLLKDKVNGFQQKKAQALAKLESDRKKELNPVLNRIQQTIDEYGRKNNYDMIFRERGGISYYRSSLNITEEVTKAVNEGAKGK